MNKQVMVKTFEEMENSFNSRENMAKALYEHCEEITSKLIRKRVECKELESELNMYRNALTQSVARPAGVLPDCEQWYCAYLSGNVVVKSK